MNIICISAYSNHRLTFQLSLTDGLSDAFDLSGLSSSVPDNNREKKSKSPAAFLGENSNLVNLDNLVGTKQGTPGLGKSHAVPSLINCKVQKARTSVSYVLGLAGVTHRSTVRLSVVQ